MGRGTHRGFITHEELSKSLGKRNLSDENLSQAFIHILDEGIVLVEKKSDFKVLRKKENSSKEEGKTIEKSDDPIRMYLREMGGVELLSREGEIAIAKRIEAGREKMIGAICESPMTIRSIINWKEAIKDVTMLLRDIVDLEATYDMSDISDSKLEDTLKLIESGGDNLSFPYGIVMFFSYKVIASAGYYLDSLLNSDIFLRFSFFIAFIYFS